MKLINLTCPQCGAQLQVDADKKTVYCQYCGAKLLIDDEVQHVQYDNAEQAGYQFEKGRQRAQNEARNNITSNQYRPKNPNVQTPKKSKIWLWILGWLVMFPVPLTILMLRNNKLNKKARIAIIAVAWILYLIICLPGFFSDSSTSTTTAYNNSSYKNNSSEKVIDSQSTTEQEVSTSTITEPKEKSINNQGSSKNSQTTDTLTLSTSSKKH